jgi:hypothetical protein
MASAASAGKGHTGADAQQHHRRQHVDKVVALRRHPSEGQKPRRHQCQTGDHRGAGAEPADQPVGPAQRQAAHHDGDRQERQPDPEGAVTQHVLDVQDADEEHAEHARGAEQLAHVRAGQDAGPENPQRHQWSRGGGLADDERYKQRGRGRGECDRPRRGPAILSGRVDDRVDGDHEGGGDQRGTGNVRSAPQAGTAVGGQQLHGCDRRGEADRHVHEEDPVPVDPVGQDAAEQQAHSTTGGGHEAVDADRLGLLTCVREHRDDHAEDDGRRHRPADALHEPGRDEELLRAGHPARRGGGREYGETADEDAATRHQVADPAGEQQKAAERDEVGVDHPGQPGLAEAQLMLDGRQRNVHDRDVENDHQHADAEHREGDPPAVLRRVPHGRSSVTRCGSPPSPPPRSWSCGCPYVHFGPFRANHNSKIAGKVWALGFTPDRPRVSRRFIGPGPMSFRRGGGLHGEGGVEVTPISYARRIHTDVSCWPTATGCSAPSTTPRTWSRRRTYGRGARTTGSRADRRCVRGCTASPPTPA